MSYHLVVYPSNILTKKCKQVNDVDQSIQVLVSEMFSIMRQIKGVGISAPQIGVLKCISIIEPDPQTSYVLINPFILEHSGSNEDAEGCLSFPGVKAIVSRPTYLKVKALDLKGEERIIEAEDRLARIFAHEIDHLNGILMIDRLSYLKRDSIKRKMLKKERKYMQSLV